MTKTLRTLALTLAVLSLVSCKKKPAARAAEAASAVSAIAADANAPGIQHFPYPQPDKNISIEGGDKSFAHVDFKPAVKNFSLDDLESSLQGVSSDGLGLVFKNASPAIRALQPGDVLFVKNELAAKVLGNVTDGDDTLVLVGEASLHDIIQSGEINIEAPIRFHGPKTATAKPGLMDRLVPPVYAAEIQTGAVPPPIGNIDIGKAITDGWTITGYSATAGDNKLNFQATLTKSLEGFVARVAMKGWVGNIDFASNIQFSGGAAALQKGFQGVNQTTGNIQFDWEIGKSTPGAWTKEDRIKLPAAVTIPLAPMLGGLPLEFSISSALLIHPLLTGGNEYSRGGFNVSWDNGNLETSSNGPVQGAAQSANSMQTHYEVTSDSGVSAVSPDAMLISYCAPRFELKLNILGTLSTFRKVGGFLIDHIESHLMSLLPSSLLNAVASSVNHNVTATNILASNADLYIQFVFTEGETRSATISPMPCSKQDIKFDVDAGGDAQLFGLTPNAKTSTNLYTTRFSRYAPASDFCKGV